MILHVLTKQRKFKSWTNSKAGTEFELDWFVVEAVWGDSPLCVFNSLFKTHAQMRSLRMLKILFVGGKIMGLCLEMSRAMHSWVPCLVWIGQILRWYFMGIRQVRILPNAYTINMVISAYCKLGNLERPGDCFRIWLAWVSFLQLHHIMFLSLVIATRASSPRPWS